jgi:[acyl-carrier-protein] S-malonyltransferase
VRSTPPLDTVPPARRGVALLFPGQGSQQAGMAVGLYRQHPGFRDLVDQVFTAWGPGAKAVRDDWLTDTPRVPLDSVGRAQPLLFAIDWALGRMVLDWGIRPVGLLGHSVGEVAAATLSGVFTLDEAVAVMRDRVEHISGAPYGGMLAVRASAEQMAPYLHADVVVGAVNGPRQVMLTGSTEPLAESERRLRADGFTCMRARAVNPFHSPALEPAALRAVPALSALPLRAPRLPLYSGYSGAPMTSAEATEPRFWARQPAAPVLFGPALDRLLSTGDLLLVEAGPAQGLTALAKRHPAVASRRSAVVSLLPARPGDGSGDLAAVRSVLEQLVGEGHLASGAEAELVGAGDSR